MTGPDLHSDCSQCFALCCVLLPYSADAGFAATKAGGVPCANLAADDRCQIHTNLLDTGWRGCTIFECFGAGQHVSQVTYKGQSWREPEVNRGEMAAVFSAMRVVHEMLFHLQEALQRQPHGGAAQLQQRLLTLREACPEDVLTVDLDALIEEVGDVLDEISAQVRDKKDRDKIDTARPDLSGRDLRSIDLTDANLRGALLMAADLRGADLGLCDLLGADLRDSRLDGADLSKTLFLTQPQLNAAYGDADTQVPLRLRNPWVN